MADEAYQKRIRELQKYVPFLEHTIKRLKNETGKLREAQISKLQSLLVILTDPKKKLKFDALKKCEEVILKLYDKVEKKPATDTMQKYMCRNPPEEKMFEEPPPAVDKVTLSVARQKLCQQVELTPASPSPPPDPPLLANPVVIPTEKVLGDRPEFNNVPPIYNDNRNPNNILNWPNNALNQHFPLENRNNHPPFFPQNSNWRNEQLYVRRNDIHRQEQKKNNVWKMGDKVTINRTMPSRESIDYSDDFGVDTSVLLEDIPIPPKITPTQTRVKADRIVQEYLEEQRKKQLLKSPSPPKLNKPPLSESDLQDLLSSTPSSSEQSPLLNEDMDLDKLEELKAKLCKELEENKEKDDSLKVSKPFPVMAPKPKPKVVEPKLMERVVKEQSNIFGDLLSSLDEQIMNKTPKKPEKKEVKNVADKNKKDVKPKDKDEKKDNKIKTEVPKEKKDEKKDSKKQESKSKPKDTSKSKDTKDTKSKEKEVKTKPSDSKPKDPEVKSKENKENDSKKDADSKSKSKDTKHKEQEPKNKPESKKETDTKPKLEVKKEDLKKEKQTEPKKETKPVKTKCDKPEKSDKSRRPSITKNEIEKKEIKEICPIEEIMKGLKDSIKERKIEPQKEVKEEDKVSNTGRLSDKYPHKRKPSLEAPNEESSKAPSPVKPVPKVISPKKPLTTEVHPIKLHDPRLRNGPFSPPPVEKPPLVCNLANKFPEPISKPMPFSPPIEPYTGNRTPMDSFAGNMTPGDPFLGNRPPSDPFLGNRTPNDPFLGNRTPNEQFLGNMTPGDPFLGNRTPSDPFLGNRTPSDPFLGNRTPSDPFLGNRTPSDPFLGNRTPNDPFLANRTPSDPFLGNRTPNDPYAGSRTPNDPYAGSRTPVDPFSTNFDVDMRDMQYRNNFNNQNEQFRPNQNQFRPNRPGPEQFRPNQEQFRLQNQFRPGPEQFRRQGPEQFRQNRPNWDPGRHTEQIRPEHFKGNPIHFRPNQEQFRHENNFRPNQEQFRQNPNKFRQHEEQFRHNFNPRLPNAASRPEFHQNQQQNFNPYDLSQMKPIDFYENEDQSHERRNSEEFHNQRRNHNRMQLKSIQRVNPIIRGNRRDDPRDDRGSRNRNEDERRSRFEDRFPQEDPRRPRIEEKTAPAAQAEPKREDPRRKRFEEPKEPISEPTESKPKEDICSPLDSLYSSLSKPIVGKGYGIQNFRIPKKRKPEPKEEKKEEIKNEEEEKPVEDVEELKEEIKVEEVKKDEKEEKPEATVSKENAEPPKTEADEKLDMFNKFMKHIFDTCDSSFLLQYLDKCGISIPKSKTKRIRRIIDSDSESDEEEIKEELKEEVKEPESKEILDVKVDEEPAPITEPEQKTPEKKPPTEENSEVIETVGERIKNRRRKQLIYSSDSSPEKLAIVTSEESPSPAQEKRVTRKTAKANIPKAKRKNALELLQEDLRDMFISEGVLTATGKRMCRMMKEHQEQEMYNQLQDPKSKVKEAMTSDDDDVPLLIKCKNMKNKKKSSIKQESKEEPVEEAKENEPPQRRLRSSPRVLLEKINIPLLKSSDEESTTDEKEEKKDEITFAAPEVPVKKRKTRRGKAARKRYYMKRKIARSSSACSSQSTIDSTAESETTDADTMDTETTEVETLESATEVETAEGEEKPQQKKQFRNRKPRRQTIDSETTTVETEEFIPEIETAECENKQNKKPIKKKETTEVKTVDTATVQTTESEEKTENKRPVRKRNSVKIFESELDDEMFDLETIEDEKPENKRPVRKRNSVKMFESEIDDEKLEAELEAIENEDKSEKKKPIKKKRNSWAHGVIPKEKKRKAKKTDRSASSLSMNTEISDQMSVTESVNEDADVAEVEDLQLTSQHSDEEYALLQIDIKPDRNYYFDNRNRFDCKLCDYSGKFIVHHYRTKHTESETMISRLSPDQAEFARSEADLKNFKEIEAYEEMTSGRKRRTSYVCRFCGSVFRKEISTTFLDHLCSHTGEYRYYCKVCTFMSANKKALSSHCYSSHPELKKPLTLKAKWPSPPNFRIVFGYMCKACNFTQLLKTNVEQHIKVSHLGNNVEIIKISMSSKPAPLQGLKSPKELEEKVEDQPEEDNIEEVKETTPEPELEPVKDKEPNMTVFLEPDDISLREQLIEEERRKKMEEIASNITPRRSTLQFVDQLKNKLQSANSINNQLETIEPEVIDCETPIDIENHTIKTLNEEITDELSSQDFSLKISSTVSLAETDPETETDQENIIQIASTCSLAGLESSETENEESQMSSGDVTEIPCDDDEEEEVHISEEEMDISVELDIPTDSKQKGVMDTIQRLAAKLQNPKMPENIPTEVEETEQEPENIIEADIVEREEPDTVEQEKPDIVEQEETDNTDEKKEDESSDVEKIINVGAIEVRIRNKEQIYICKIQDCHFRSSYKITFTKHCSDAHNLTVLCEICARENSFIYFTMTSLFVHLFDAHKSNAKIVPSAKIRIRRISGDLLSKQPEPDPLQNISEPIIETIEVTQPPEEQNMGFLQIKDVRTLTEEEEHKLQPKSPQKTTQENLPTPIQIAPNLAIIQSNLQSDVQTSQNIKQIVPINSVSTPQNMKQITTINTVSTPSGRKVIQTKKIMIPIHELPKYVTVKQTMPQKKPTDVVTWRKTKKVLKDMLTFPKILDLYKCPIESCAYSSNTQKEFRIHLITHKWRQVSICVYCQEQIFSNHLISHIDSVHGHCTLQCAFCLYRAVSKVYLLDHQKNEHKHNNDVLMDGFFYDVDPINKNFVFEPPPKATVILPYRCTQDSCNLNFLVADDLMVHLHVCHKKYFACGICEDRSLYFVTALALIQHYVIHDIARYQCQYCLCGAHTMESLFSHYAKKHPHLGPVCYVRQTKDKNHVAESVDELVTMHMELKCPVETLNTITQSTCTTPTPEASTENPSSPVVTSTIPEDQNVSQPIADVDVAGVDNSDKDIDVIDVDDVQFSEPYVILKHRNVESKNAVENAVDPLLVDEKSNDSAEIVDLEADVEPEIVDLVQDFYVCGIKNCSYSSDSLKQFRNHLFVCDVLCSSYNCSICSLKFMSVNGLCDHYETHREMRFSCGLCDSKERFKHQILQHVKDVHNISRPTLSPVDPNKSDLKKDYFIVKPREEKQDDSILKSTLLESSNKVISIPTLLFNPETEEENRFTCTVCSHKSAQANSILQHMKEAHQIHYTQFNPVDKKKKDLSKDHFTVKAVESSQAEDSSNTFGPDDIDSLPRQPVYKSEIKCKLCNYNTKVRSNMQRHLQQHVDEKAVSETAPVNPVPCLEKNEKMFDKMTNLAASSHYGRMGAKPVDKADTGAKDDNTYPGFIPSSKRFVCGALNCNYLTHGDQMLRHHLTALHADELIYKCPHCQIDIPSEIDGLEIDQILFHLKMHDLHLYKCPNCEFFHYQKHKIERHISDNHPDENKNIMVIRELDNSANLEDDRPALPASFIEQSNVESEFKPWRCGYCSYRCQSKSEIQNHTSTQHGVKSQFKCAKCKFRCSAKTNFITHFKKLHPETPEPDIYTVYYKTTEEEEARASQEELSEPSSSQPEFDTTPLWMKNKTGVKHIRGILVEETKSSPKRTPKIIEKLQEIRSHLGEGTSKVENVTKNLFQEPKEPKKLMKDNQKSQQNFKFPSNYGSAQDNFYGCPSCESFKTRSVKEFTEHLYAEMNYYRCACTLCDQRFIDLGMAKQHWSSYHSTEGEEEQLTPLTPDAKVENWVDHCILHQTKMLRKDDSDVTSENTSESSSLDLLTDSASPSKLKCEFCDFMAKNIKTLRKHQKRHDSYCPFKCDYCGYKSLTVRSIKNHHRAKHKSGEVSYSIVPTQLEENNSLKRKRDEDEDNSENPAKILVQGEVSEEIISEPDVIPIEETTDDMQTFYGCLHCPRKSEELHTIRKHFFELHAKNGPFKYKKVNLDKNKKHQYKCSYCNWFGDTNALRLHCLKSHEDQAWAQQRNTKLKCSLCAVMYSKVKQMKKHFMNKHPLKNLTFFTLLEDGTILDSTEFFEEKNVAVKCNYCADQFENKDELLNHHTLLHSHLEFEKEDDPEPKKYKCAQCEHTSNSYNSMRIHLRRHSKPYMCSICNAVCFFPSQLKNHHIKLHPEEPFVMNDANEIKKQLEKLSESMLQLNPDGTYSNRNKLKRPNTTELDEPPAKIVIIDDDTEPPVKRNVAKKSTALPAVPKNVAKKSTANKPKCLEFSYYGTRPCDINDYKTVMSEINIMGKVRPINVVAMSHVLNLFPVVPLIDINKTV